MKKATNHERVPLIREQMDVINWAVEYSLMAGTFWQEVASMTLWDILFAYRDNLLDAAAEAAEFTVPAPEAETGGLWSAIRIIDSLIGKSEREENGQ